MALPSTTDGGSGSEASASAAGSAAVSISGPRGPETSAAASDVGGRRQTGGWRQFRRRALSETYDTPAPRLPRAVQPYRFFVYSGALNQSWLRHCHGFNALERSTATEKLGEVRLYDALERHRLRTHNASQATFFFTPLWEYTSWALGRCRGTTHTQRMAAAAEQLAASPYYQVSPSPSPNPNPYPYAYAHPYPNPSPDPNPNPNTTGDTGVETTSGARPPRRSMAPSSTSDCSR